MQTSLPLSFSHTCAYRAKEYEDIEQQNTTFQYPPPPYTHAHTGEKEFEGEGGDFEEPSSTPTSTPQQPQEQRSGSGMAGGGRGEELTYEEIALYAAPEVSSFSNLESEFLWW